MNYLDGQPADDGTEPYPDEVEDLEDDDGEPFCPACQNTGYIDCFCGGDLCVCDNGGEMPCPKCDRWF